MARPITYTKPRRPQEAESIRGLARALNCGDKQIRVLIEHGLIKQVRGKWETARVVPVLDAWNTIAEAMGRRNQQDVEAVRRLLKTGKPPERETPAATKATATKGKAEPTPPAEESETVAVPKHPLQRKQFFEGELLKMRVSERRGELLERAQVVQDLQTVAELVPKLLDPFIREIYPELVLISNPEEAIEWGTAKLRERVDRIADEMVRLYGKEAAQQ